MRILIVEDQAHIAETIIDEISSLYAVDAAETGKKGSYLARTNDYDLVMLDLSLPDIDGVEVCRQIRADKQQVPILILTGKQEVDQKVLALDAGADDYLTKPFSFSELNARIRALLRRSPKQMLDDVIKIDNLSIDIPKRLVTRGENIVRLRRKEFDLLEYMMRNSGKVLTRSMILEHVWDNSVDAFTNSIDVHIKLLRDRIDKPFAKKLIKTVHGLGYKIDG